MAFETIRDIVVDCAQSYKDMTAFRYIVGKNLEDKSYNELKADSEAISRMLKSLDLLGKHVAIVGASSYEWVISYLGTVNSASVAVPLDSALPPAELYELINRADVEAVIYDKTQKAMAAELEKNCPAVKYMIAMQDSVKKENGYSLWDLVKENEGSFETEIDPDKMCTLMFTSGTTGKSKGVMLSHRNLATNVENCVVFIEPGKVSMSVLPIHHSFCLTSGILKSLSIGSCICINDSMMHFARNLQRFQPEIMLLVPLIIETIYTQLRDVDPSIPKQMVAKKVFGENLKIIFSGGAYLNPDYVDFFEEYGISILQGYGMTESSPVISNNNQVYAKTGSVGKPLANCEVKFDNEEICVRGTSVMLGYYKMPEETAEALDADGWLHTGDLGRIDEDGYLYITGRKKNLIILSNGENISPEELENAISKSELVKEILVRENGQNIEAEIFPDMEYASAHGIDDVPGALQKVIDEFNKDMPLYKRVTSLKIRDEEFEKSTTKKIKRF